MKSFTFLFFLLLSICAHTTESHSSFVWRSFTTSRSIVDSALNAMGGVNKDLLISIALSGVQHQKGHFPEPGQTRTLKLRSYFAFDVGNGSIDCFDTITTPSGSKYNRRSIVTPESAYGLDYGDTIALQLTACDIEPYRFDFALPLPYFLLDELAEGNTSLRYMGESVFDGRPCHTIGIGDNSELNVVLFIDLKDYFLRGIERILSDSLEGDYIRAYYYRKYVHIAGYAVPQRIRITNNPEIISEIRIDTAWSGSLSNADLFRIPPGYSLQDCIKPPPQSEAVEPHAALESIGAGLMLLSLPNANSKAVLADCGNYCVVFDAPGTTSTGEFILATVKKTFPNKPLRYVCITHHHEDHLGSIRAFINAGVTIVTTPGNQPYIEKLARAPHVASPDALARSRRAPKFAIVNDSLIFKDKARSVIAYDIGAKSRHTSEYLIFYLPDDKLLIQGDLGYFPQSQKIYPAGARLRGFYEAINDLGLEVDTIVQNWPLQNALLTVPISYVKKLVKLATAER